MINYANLTWEQLLRKVDNDTINLTMFDATPEPLDGLLTNSMIELKIYN